MTPRGATLSSGWHHLFFPAQLCSRSHLGSVGGFDTAEILSNGIFFSCCYQQGIRKMGFFEFRSLWLMCSKVCTQSFLRFERSCSSCSVSTCLILAHGSDNEPILSQHGETKPIIRSQSPLLETLSRGSVHSKVDIDFFFFL